VAAVDMLVTCRLRATGPTRAAVAAVGEYRLLAGGASLRVKLGEVAAEFEAVHNVQRAQTVGSAHHIIPAAELCPSIAAAIERGIARLQCAVASTS